ncbi:MAG: hypothetical protein R3C60_12520 [Parvularculaceae bacterium]
MLKYLEFEKPVAELDTRIEELKRHSANKENVADEIRRLEARSHDLLEDTYSKLSRWQKTLVARHAERPHFSDYVKLLVDDFTPLA